MPRRVNLMHVLPWKRIRCGWLSQWTPSIPVGGTFRPGQFIGRGCPQPTIGLPVTKSSTQCTQTFEGSKASEFHNTVPANPSCLGQHSLEAGLWAQQQARRCPYVCIFRVKCKWFTAFLNYLCHCSSLLSIFFVLLHFVFGKVLFTTCGFAEADQKASAYQSATLSTGSGDFLEMTVPSCQVWREGFSKLPSALKNS